MKGKNEASSSCRGGRVEEQFYFGLEWHYCSLGGRSQARKPSEYRGGRRRPAVEPGLSSSRPPGAPNRVKHCSWRALRMPVTVRQKPIFWNNPDLLSEKPPRVISASYSGFLSRFAYFGLHSQNSTCFSHYPPPNLSLTLTLPPPWN